MKIYTKTGDKGETGLRGGARVRKNHPRVAAYGEVDELNSALGVSLSALPEGPAFEPLRKRLERIQDDLFHVGAALADPKAVSRAVPEEKWLETEIDRMSEELKPLKQFILPGGAYPAALLHSARSVCRRAERAVAGLKDEAPAAILIYLNRLSDYLFTAARWVNRRLKRDETPWKATR